MSHQVLARKWRPQSFEQLVGQQHVVQALANALDSGRLHHAYLLTGTRGVGKTTIGRILARCFNCEQGVSSKPCGECSVCKEISEGRSIDLIEVDAASRTKVDEMRELLDNVPYLPTQARYKIYLIDEVHMLTNNSFNALLKTLEEPPPHVIFILATTHPQKIPATVLSRCLQFHLKNMPAQLIVEHLEKLLDEENVSAELGGLQLIARAAAGSMRDALSITDQAIAHGSESISEKNVQEMLGVIDQQILLDLLNVLAEDDGPKLLDLLSRFLEYASDLTVLIDELLSLFHRIVVEQVVPDGGSEGYAYAADIKRYAKLFSPEEVQIYYQTVLQGKRDMPLAPDPLTGMEIIALRLLAFRQMRDDNIDSVDSASLLGDGDENIAATANGTANDMVGDRGATLTVKKPRPIDNAATSAVPAASTDTLPADSSEPDSLLATAPKKKNAPAVSENSAQLDNNAPDISALDNKLWCQIFSTLPLSGLIRSVVSHCVLVSASVDTEIPVLAFAIAEEDAALYKEGFVKRLQDSLVIYFGKKIQAKISVLVAAQRDEIIGDRESPDQYKLRLRQEKMDSTVKTLENDGNVRELISVFDATLVIDSVKVVDD